MKAGGRSAAGADAVRIEHDLLGDKAVPADAYYGVQTARAMENFNISGVPLKQYPDLVNGLALVKQAAARASHECGAMDRTVTKAIEDACKDILAGKLHDQFLVDLFQGGAGTSTNMNANEVIANRALDIMGHPRGAYAHCSPNDHVNLSQSTNDADPLAGQVFLGFSAVNLPFKGGTLVPAPDLSIRYCPSTARVQRHWAAHGPPACRQASTSSCRTGSRTPPRRITREVPTPRASPPPDRSLRLGPRGQGDPVR